MNTKHTPGPWKVINGWDENGKGTYFPSVVLLDRGQGDMDDRARIVINVSHDQKIPSLMANAKLIAAAPCMLAALEALQGVESWINDDNMKRLVNKTITEAIQKATM